MPDKIVMAHSKEYRSNKTFVTIEAHTGRSLWHSHAVMTTAITNLWQGGARYLGAPGKHDQVAGDANHVVMVRANRGGITTGGGGTSTADNENQQSSLPPPNFPQRNASDMFAPGQWVRTAFLSHFMLKTTVLPSQARDKYRRETKGRFSQATLMLPTHEHLPFLDTSGPAYLKRNFSALGFSCENWQNESVNLTILPVALHGPDGETLPIDDFTPETAHLWRDAYPAAAHSDVVPEPLSPSGYALQLVCAANATSCGAPDPKSGLCPAGCLLDSSMWCQAVETTFVNRLPSRAHPLPTELDPLNTIDVRTFESFDLKWKMSSNYQPPPSGSASYPIGVQTMDYPTGCFSNKTLTFCGE